MHFKGELDPTLCKDIEDWMPQAGELFKPGSDYFLGGCRIAGDIGPQRRTGETGNDGDAESVGGPGSRHHLLGGPLRHFARVAVAPDIVGQDGLMAGVDGIADSGANTMIAQHRCLQFVAGEQIKFLLAVIVFAQGALDLEVVAPATQVNPLVAPFSCLGSQFSQR